MKAVRLHEIGGPENLTLDEIAVPEPGADEARVRVRAAAFNHRDVFITQGLYPNISLPKTLGADGAGELDGRRVLIDPLIGWGDDERIWRSDSSILGMPREGTFAEYVCVPRENVHDTPGHLTDEQAAALPLAGSTAYRALFTRGELQAEENVLITGIGGGVQTMALLFALAAGANVFVTSGSDEKLDRAKALGAKAGANYKGDPEWNKTLRKAAGHFDMIVDSAGGETFARALTTVRPGGRVVTYGGTNGDAKIKMFPVFWNQIDIRGSSMGSPRDFAAMLAFVSQHRIVPVVDKVFALEDAVEAAQRMHRGDQFGRIVLSVAE
ncbi:MAG TPA: zinc-binding dehydrogenase [Candidatus Baltobacteraceae bacterium]|nr:zinc-binding dehydrogenase [Candidatus Baltobacteraceae bacterium]